MSSPKGSPGGVHKSVTSKLAGELGKFEKKEADKEHKEAIQKIVDILKKEPKTVPKVLSLLTSGALLPSAGKTDDKFHRTAVRYSDISIKFIMGWVTSLNLPSLDPISITRAQVSDACVVRKLLTYATGVQSSDKLCSKSKSEWLSIMTNKHKEMGNRLQNISKAINEQGEICWEKCGVYQPSSEPNTMTRIDGAIGKLPAALAIDSSWVVESNWCSVTASLAHPETGLKFRLATLFGGVASLSSSSGGGAETKTGLEGGAPFDKTSEGEEPNVELTPQPLKKRRGSLGPLAAPLGDGMVPSKLPGTVG